MTATEVKALTDRELDALVAEKVMGEPMPPKPSEDDGELAMIGDGRKSDGGNWLVCGFHGHGHLAPFRDSVLMRDGHRLCWYHVVINKDGHVICPIEGSEGKR